MSQFDAFFDEIENDKNAFPSTKICQNLVIIAEIFISTLKDTKRSFKTISQYVKKEKDKD